jgi:predicted TPR repeat methyltransferase
MADGLHHAAAVLREWAEEDTGGPAADAADRLEVQYETLEGELGGHDPGDAPAEAGALEGIADPEARRGALVGWAMVTDRKAGQVTGYFTGQADPGTASIVREFGEDYEAIRAAALDALGDGEAAVAAEAADSLVAAAYDEYVERLEAQGVNPKPVC